MGTVGTRSTTLARDAGDSGFASASAKCQPPKEKKLGEATNDSGGTEDGSGGSGPEGSGGGGEVGSGVVEVVKTRVVEAKISAERSFGDLNIGLSDAEDGGLVETGLLKLRGTEGLGKLESILGTEKKAVSDGTETKTGLNSGVEVNGNTLDETEADPDEKLVIMEVPIVDTGEKNEGKEEEMGEEEYEFFVGDFVWGKIKSHPWWPGQICDPSDATEYAAKLKVKNRHLVAYFGDGTFAWCHPSQLKPFEENFEEMSKQSSSKAFGNAVQQAVDEIGRLMKLKISCGCVRKEILSGLSRPLAVNAGLKEGVLVPEGRVEKLLAYISEPADLLAELKHIAEDISVTSVLELNVLKNWLSAFYCSKGDYQLPIYHEPQPIPGLDDDWKAVEVPVQGPFEDWLSSPLGTKTGQSDLALLQCSTQILENRQHHRRKQKSIADIMGGDDDVQDKTMDGVMTKEGAISEKPGSSSGRKKQKGSDSHGESNLTSKSEKRRGRPSKSPMSTHIQKVSSVENDCNGSKEETKKGPLSRRRKKDEGIGTNSSDGETKEEAGDGHISNDRESLSGGLQSDSKDGIDKRALSRERKKSKYLSPPFTSINMGKMKRDIEIESLKVSNEARLGEQVNSAASNLIGSPQALNCCTEALQKKVSTDELGVGHETSRGSTPKISAEDWKKSIDPVKANASTSEVLSDVRSVAVNPSCPIKRKSFEIVWDFMSIFRDSIYRNGSNYKLYKNRQPHKKRKSLNSEPGSLGKGLNQIAGHLPEGESGQRNIKNNQEQAVETPSSKRGRRKSKHAAETSDLKTKYKKTDEKASPASLFVTFGPGSSLPTKDDLLKIYGRFGELDEKETEMFYNNFCARVSFLRSTDAEEAFNHSLNDSPFGVSNVNFRLQNRSGASKIRELSEISNSHPAKSRGKTASQSVASQAPVGEASQLDFIRHKLEMMTSMLENSDGKVSAVTKSKLESEIKELLKAVSTMVESSS